MPRTALAPVQPPAVSLLIQDGVIATAALALFLLLGGGAVVHFRVRRSLVRNMANLESLAQAFGLSHGMLRAEDGRITFWADGMEQLYGYPAQEAVGRGREDARRGTQQCAQGDVGAFGAVLREGAVHGVARTVAKIPWKNEPRSPSLEVQPSRPRFALCGRVISKTPNKFRAKTRTTALIARTK